MKRHRHTSSEQGFSLIEMLVVIFIIAVLAAIAGPGWLALLNRQRMTRAREDAVQVIRSAQVEARKTRSAQAVIFDYDGRDDGNGDQTAPTMARAFVNADDTISAPNSAWEELGGGELRPDQVIVSTVDGQDDVDTHDGSAARATALVVEPDGTFDADMIPFTVKVELPSGASRCATVQSILGAMVLTDDDDCQAYFP
jgi:prepilin-type N-terminal cleavage/methylation domain-containing protein